MASTATVRATTWTTQERHPERRRHERHRHRVQRARGPVPGTWPRRATVSAGDSRIQYWSVGDVSEPAARRLRTRPRNTPASGPVWTRSTRRTTTATAATRGTTRTPQRRDTTGRAP